jgi:RHS repeat-associated protein
MRRVFAILALCSLALASRATEPGQMRGFVADTVFDFQSGIDTVNTFQGNVSLQLPIGPTYPVGGNLGYALSLTYNAKVWDYETHNGAPYATPNRRSNAGLGWLLSLGRLILPESGTNHLENWIYEMPDGSEHVFWDALHQGDAVLPASGTIRKAGYTRDGSYLRLLARDFDHDGNDDLIEIESPDGLIRSFDPANGNLTSIRDRTNNAVFIEYSASVAQTPCNAGDSFVWKITDSQNARTSYVCFDDLPYPDSTYPGQITRVVLPAPPDASGAPRTIEYAFVYGFEDIQRGCHSSLPGQTPVVHDIPMLLTVIRNPNSAEATYWSFTYNTGNTNNVCETGTLASYRLPTRATVSYTYRYWYIPVEECAGTFKWIKPYPGIATRTITGLNIQEATWHYSSLQSSSNGMTTICADEEVPVRRLIPSEQLVTTVIDPLGNVTEHFYSAWPMSSEQVWDPNGFPLPVSGNSPNGFRKREYGLPFTRMPGTMSDGRFLSQRTYSPGGYQSNPRVPLRSTYLTYELDDTICTLLDPFCLGSNGRITSERIVYHDDGDRIADTAHSSYDGLGNMRQTQTGGTFEGNNTVTTYTAFNERNAEVNPGIGIDSGTYPANFRMPPLAQPWILNTASSRRVTEGSATSVVQTCHDPLTGLLEATRVLKQQNRGTTDILAAYGHDANGNVTSEAYAGGDVRANAPASGNLCATANNPPTADYTIQHTYDTGVRATSKYAGATFLFLDQTVDRRSGVVLTSRDTAGIPTHYQYDTAFRLRNVVPTGTANTTYDYFNAIGSGASATPAQVNVRTVSQQGQGHIESRYQYDALGRMWRQSILMPDNTWSYRQTERNGMGWPEWTSEFEKLPATGVVTPQFKTRYSGYDPFGRPTSIAAPDLHVTALAYRGAATVTRTVRIGTGTTEVPMKTREVYDRQRRLRSVTLGYQTPESQTTTYAYDVGNRLTSVSMPGDYGVQTRVFRYDNRGFLEYEELPELGAQGYGRTYYASYDARGHAQRRITGTANGPFDLTYTFDSAERLTSSRHTPSGRELSRFIYDGGFPHCSGNRCNGKLAAAGRYNHFDDMGMVTVAEIYQYDGPGGRMSRRDTAVGSNDGIFQGADFFDYQFYDDLGEVSVIGYPCRKVNNTCTAPQRTVENRYTNGRLTSVPGFAASISYQPNGMQGTIAHVNGVSDTFTPNPYGMPRPCSMLTYRGSLQVNAADPCGYSIPSSSPINWATGQYKYDGDGNVTSIGDMKYRYDAYSRLVGWGQNLPDGSWFSGTMTIDAYGNPIHTTFEGCSAPGSGQSQCMTTDILDAEVAGTTNHYVGVLYDDAGNVTRDANQHQFTYDAFNRARTSTSSGRQFRYIYGPNEERIAIVERVPATGGVMRNRTTWTLRGFGRALLSSWTDDSTSGNRVWTWVEDEIWRGSQLLASVQASRTLHYSLDHLGSPRVVTSASGQLIGTQYFEPHGHGGTTDGGFLQYTGQERDAAILGGPATMPDSFHARLYDKAGRFLSMDPVVNVDATLVRPQLWNRYSYVANNPLKSVDPTGEVLRSMTGQARFREIAGLAADRIQFGEDGTLDTSELTQEDLTTNEGALLLDQMATSKCVYTYEEGQTAMTADGPQRVNGVKNLDDNSVDLVLNGTPVAKGPQGFPPAGVNGSITVDPSVDRYDRETGAKLVPTRAIAFHELAEAFAKVEQGIMRGPNAGPGAHIIAVEREKKLMQQRPDFTPYPAGGSLTRRKRD